MSALPPVRQDDGRRRQGGSLAHKAKRVFFKTTIVVELLSEVPVRLNSLGELCIIKTGDCSERQEIVKQERLNGQQAAEALLAHRVAPDFFRLTEAGKDEKEEA